MFTCVSVCKGCNATHDSRLDLCALIERMGEEKVQHIYAGRNTMVDVVAHDDGGNFTIRDSERPERFVTLSRSMIPALVQLLKPLAK